MLNKILDVKQRVLAVVGNSGQKAFEGLKSQKQDARVFACVRYTWNNSCLYYKWT